MNKKLTKTLSAIAGFLLIFGLLCTVICACSADREFYYSEYAKIGVAEDIGITDEKLREATDVLLDYTEGKRDDMLLYAEIDGETVEYYNERETLHMYDVRNLFRAAQTVGLISLIVGAVGLIAIAFFTKDRSGLYSGYLIGNGVFLAIVAMLGIYAAIDFTSFWTSFHLLFFTNDLWLLDPATCNLINMVPEQFFFDLVFKIIAIFVGIAVVLAAGSFAALKIRKNKKNRAE